MNLITADGPGQGGLVRGLQLFSSDANLAYAAILGGGIYKSTDGGTTWSASNNGLTNLEARTIRAKPGSTTVLYVTTDGGEGFYKSTDGGASWQAKNAGLPCRFGRNAFVASTSGHVLLGTSCGAFRSLDEGETWSRICSANLFSNVNSLNSDPTGQFIRIATGNGVYVSGDSGATCTQSSNGITAPNGPILMDLRFLSGGVLMATVQGNGVFRSIDNGTNWFPAAGIPANAPPIAGFGNVGTTWWVALDGVGIYKSTDNGENWAVDNSLNGMPKHMRLLTASPDGATWWAMTVAGLYKSTDSGANWTKSSAGLPQGHVVNALSSGSLLEVYAQGETIYKSTDGGTTWTVSDSGIDGKLTHRSTGVIPVGGTSTVYASTINYGLYKSVDGGANWSAINNGLPSNLVESPATFRPAPSNPQIGYAFFGSGKGAFRTSDGGENWTDITAGLPEGNARFTVNPAIHPTNPDIVYLPTRDGLYKTTDGGNTWSRRSPGGGGFLINRAEVDPVNPEIVVAVSSIVDAFDRALSTSGFYVSQDGGNTWRQLAANEKIPHARVLRSGTGGTTDTYVISRGHFNEVGDGVFKCVDIASSSFNADTHCSEVPREPGQGIPWSLSVGFGKITLLASTTGIYRHRFHFLGPDFNNDGRADILWRNTADGQNWIWLMNGSGFFGESPQGFNGVEQIRTVTSPWFIAGFGDFDGNGKTDILWRNSSSGENYIYLMDGFTIIGEGYIRTVADLNWQVAGIGDFVSRDPLDSSDNDGRSDILWRNAVTGENYVYPMDGLTIAATEGYVRTVADPNWQVAGVGDFDGDSISDILWRNATTGENYLYPMIGLSIKPSEGFLRTVPSPWTIAGLGDFNQDDRMDIVWRNSSTGENYVYPMDGTAILSGEGYLPTVPDTDWAIVGLGDYDGQGDENSVKGMSDILWRHASGSNYLWRMGGPTVVTTMCGSMGCTNGYLPTINAPGFGVVHK